MMPRSPRSRCNLTWEQTHGTTYSGNLPQYNVLNNGCGIDISLITYPDIKLEQFGFYNFKCPYSIQADLHMIRDYDINSPTYFGMIDVSSQITDHIATQGVMIRESRGSKHGYLCVDDLCPYYIATGKRYFHL